MRINASMSFQDMIIAMYDKDMKAFSLLVKIVKHSSDPLTNLLTLDIMGIYGSELCKMFDETCNSDIAILIETLENLNTTKIPHCKELSIL